jgi:hypothetical protein
LQRSRRHLVRHPGCGDAVRGIAVDLERSTDALRVRYELEAPFDRLRIPATRAFRPGEKLWQHTCFEIFLSPRMPAYREFNFSPSREWAAYSFSRYREGEPASGGVEDLAVTMSGDVLTVEATIRCAKDRLKVALSAVIEDREGSLSYWALRHPPGKPDFHHRDGFALELDEIRD